MVRFYLSFSQIRSVGICHFLSQTFSKHTSSVVHRHSRWVMFLSIFMQSSIAWGWILNDLAAPGERWSSDMTCCGQLSFLMAASRSRNMFQLMRSRYRTSEGKPLRSSQLYLSRPVNGFHIRYCPWTDGLYSRFGQRFTVTNEFGFTSALMA